MRLISALTGNRLRDLPSRCFERLCTRAICTRPCHRRRLAGRSAGATIVSTPGVARPRASEIKEGKVISLTNPLSSTALPLFGVRFHHDGADAGTLAPGAAVGKNYLTYREDNLGSCQSHVGTHLEGMGPIGDVTATTPDPYWEEHQRLTT